MSAILSYVNNWFFPKSSLTDENVYECPICYTSCKKFKKMHANSKNQPLILLASLVDNSYLNIGTTPIAPFATSQYTHPVIITISDAIFVDKPRRR